MKGESRIGKRGRGELSRSDAEAIAVSAFERMAADPDRLGRFLALTGLDPGTLRAAASGPDFLPAVLNHVASDEQLLLDVAQELDLPPERLARARDLLSPEPDWGR
jgi:hypothetical protein